VLGGLHWKSQYKHNLGLCSSYSRDRFASLLGGAIPPADGRVLDLEEDRGWCIEMLAAVSMVRMDGSRSKFGEIGKSTPNMSVRERQGAFERFGTNRGSLGVCQGMEEWSRAQSANSLNKQVQFTLVMISISSTRSLALTASNTIHLTYLQK
jgi:hypothetical protein